MSAYDHRDEVTRRMFLLQKRREISRANYETALARARKEFEDEMASSQLEEDVIRNIHRLCSRGGNEPCCGMMPGEIKEAPRSSTRHAHDRRVTPGSQEDVASVFEAVARGEVTLSGGREPSSLQTRRSNFDEEVE